MQNMSPGKSALGLDANVVAGLCYIPVCYVNLILSIITLVTDKTNKLARFHAFQSIFLMIGLIVVMVLYMCAGIVGAISLSQADVERLKRQQTAFTAASRDPDGCFTSSRQCAVVDAAVNRAAAVPAAAMAFGGAFCCTKIDTGPPSRRRSALPASGGRTICSLTVVDVPVP